MVGYAGKAYHAWISVWTEESGWVDGVIHFDGVTWKRMDPTFASYENQSEAIMKYIGAKDAFVRAPFMLEGVLIGLIGAAIPLFLLYFAYGKVIAYIAEKFAVLTTFIDFLPVTELYKTLLPVGLALGVGIGFLGSFLTTKKHLKA